MRPWLALLAAGLLSGCTETGASQDAAVERPGGAYGSRCQTDPECASALCVDRVCSKLCSRQTDCPSVDGEAYDCGEVTEKQKVACYPRRAPTVPYTVGHNCSTDLKCAVGFSCLGQPGTADRYCSKTCETDRDCPPRFRCAGVRTGIQDPEPESWCRRREFCHPCVIDDQCGDPPENLCVRDPDDQGYCSRSCAPGGSGCLPWAQCTEVRDQQFQCTPKGGYCYKAEGGQLCDPCLSHGWESQGGNNYCVSEIGTCQEDGACYLLSTFTGETICITPCSASVTCPAGGPVTYSCFSLKSLGGSYCLPSVTDPDTGALSFGSCAP